MRRWLEGMISVFTLDHEDQSSTYEVSQNVDDCSWVNYDFLIWIIMFLNSLSFNRKFAVSSLMFIFVVDSALNSWVKRGASYPS